MGTFAAFKALTVMKRRPGDGARSVENTMKTYLAAATIMALSAGVAVAQSGPQSNDNPKGIGAEVRSEAHAQHDATDKGIGADVSARARAQRTSAKPTPSPTPTPSPSPSPSSSSASPTGPSAQ
jgi:hypothetical protein